MTQDTRKRTLHYTIEHLPDEGFAVVEMRPHIIGRFGDECHAQIFLKSLTNDLRPVRKSGAALPAPKKEIRAKATPPLADDGPTEDQWARALARRAAGEDLKAIAKDMGLPYNILRGKWAGQQRGKNKISTAPPNGNTPATDDGGDMTTPPQWTDELDMTILQVGTGGSLEKLAKIRGIPIDILKARYAELQRDIAADMAANGEGAA